MIDPCSTCVGGRTQRCYGFKPAPVSNDVMIVTEYPIYAEQCDAIQKLLQRLANHGVDLNRICWSSVVSCIGKAWRRGALNCKNFTMAEIVTHRPKAVVTVGKSVLKALFNTKSLPGETKMKIMGGHEFVHLHASDSEELEDEPELLFHEPTIFGKIKAAMDGGYPPNPTAGKDYRRITTWVGLKDFLYIETTNNWLGFDIETGGYDDSFDMSVGSDPWHPNSYLIGISLCPQPGHAAFVDIRENPSLLSEVLDYAASKSLICQNGKFDLNFILVKYGIDLFPYFKYDTMLADHAYREWSKKRSLKYLASVFLYPDFDGYEEPLEEFFGKTPKHKRDYGTIPSNTIAPYACMDADVTYRLMCIQWPELVRNQVDGLVLNRYMSYQETYAEIERNGWGHDRQTWLQLKEESEAAVLEQNSRIQATGIWQRYRSYREFILQQEGKAFYDTSTDILYSDSECVEVVDDSDLRYRYKNGRLKKTKVYREEDLTPVPSSPKFKRTVLYHQDFFNLPTIRLTDGGKSGNKQPKVDADTLKDLKNLDGVPQDVVTTIDAVLEAEVHNKRLSTYLLPALPHLEDSKPVSGWVKADGLVHCQYMLAGQDFGNEFIEGGTVSGRISARQPNMTNIPTRRGGKLIKKQFVPARRTWEGRFVPAAPSDPWVFLQADFSQLELRVLADRSGQDWMIESYQNREDLHTKLASQLFRKPVEWYQERLADDDHQDHDLAFNERLIAKTAWFAVIYGSGANKLIEILKRMDVRLDSDPEKERAKARELIRNLYRKLPAVSALKDQVAAAAPQWRTAFTRQRTTLNEFSTDEDKVQRASRQRFNFFIQGTGTDIVSDAVVRVNRWLREARARRVTRAYISGTVHDSCIVSCPESDLETVARAVKTEMERQDMLPWTPRVPFPVDLEYGPNWGELRNYTLN